MNPASPTRKILKVFPVDTYLQDVFSKELKISPILAQLLVNRGIANIEEAHKFLNVRLEQLHDPYGFADMPVAVRLIKKAAENRDKVMIFSDYDVDGITSLALLKTALAKIGINAFHYLPHRIKEGYGLNKNILPIVKQKNIKLLITADCGTSSRDCIEDLRRNNVEVIVTDHHEPIDCGVLPGASALINPKIKNCGYKYRDLAGVGVTYKLCQAFTKEALFEDLDLVCLGTVADVVPLNGENRVIAKEGLALLSETKRVGLKALIENSGIKNKNISSAFISYILGPRINASGRMDTAETALNLLMSHEQKEAVEFAQILEKYNRQRQKIEGEILKEAQGLIDKETNFKEHRIIVVAKEDWHQGVLGIVAAKLADRFYRPVIIISKTEQLCKGSGRSIKNFHLFNALLECKELLEAFGGHNHAVGLVIMKSNIDYFRDKINCLAKEKMLLEDLLPSLEVDMELSLSDLNEKAVKELEVLEPFGIGNNEPLFLTRNLKLKGQPQILGKDTLKFWVTDGNITCQAIGFAMGCLKDRLIEAGCFGLVYNTRLDTWQEQESVLLEVNDIIF
jgi:single-stranded-DNA-specific exonuclease